MSDPKWERVLDAPKQVETWLLTMKTATLHLYQPVGLPDTWVVYAVGKLKVKNHDIKAEGAKDAQMKAVMYYLELLSKASLDATGALRGMAKQCGEIPEC